MFVFYQFEKMNPYSEQHGLVFRSFVYLFKLLQEREECNFVLKASFLEIYNEKVSRHICNIRKKLQISVL